MWFPELTDLDLSGNTDLTSLGPGVCRLEKLSSLELDGCLSLKEVCLNARGFNLNFAVFLSASSGSMAIGQVEVDHPLQYPRLRGPGASHSRQRGCRGPGVAEGESPSAGQQVRPHHHLLRHADFKHQIRPRPPQGPPKEVNAKKLCYQFKTNLICQI